MAKWRGRDFFLGPSLSGGMMPTGMFFHYKTISEFLKAYKISKYLSPRSHLNSQWIGYTHRRTGDTHTHTHTHRRTGDTHTDRDGSQLQHCWARRVECVLKGMLLRNATFSGVLGKRVQNVFVVSTEQHTHTHTHTYTHTHTHTHVQTHFRNPPS